MGTEAIVMFLIGAVALWGGVAVAILNYIRASRSDTSSD
ncbi:MAG: methionine/alanine import family NSS transporter small subunit [Propionibacteriales bacterium]|nr:methionine/alanine import family NSS transporter small subunit [Propionibacteriales bacterium]